MAFMRPTPPQIHQTNLWWCWATCFEILNRVHSEKFPPPIRNQSEWVAAMQQSPARNRLLNAQGGINVHYIGEVFAAIGIRGHTFTALNPNSYQNMHDYLQLFQQNIAFIEEKLRISYLIGIYPVAGGSHFVVIYGIDDNRLHFFNPWTNVGIASETHRNAQSNRFIIGWKP